MKKIMQLLICGSLFLVYGIAQGAQTIKATNLTAIEVSVSSGNVIALTPWTKDEIEVNAGEAEFEASYRGTTAYVTADDVQDIRIKLPARLDIEVSTSAGAVLLEGDFTGRISISTSGGDISIGNATGLVTLRTSGGDITAKELRSNSTLETSGGNIVAGVASGQLRVHTSGGDLELGNVAKDLDATSGGGSIQCGNVGGSAEISTGGGDVTLGTIGGGAKISTGGGNIEVARVGGDASFRTGGGDVMLDEGKGSLKVKTGGGDVLVKSITGAVDAVTAGGDMEVHFVSNPVAASNLSTAGGEIALYVPASAKVTVDAAINIRGRWNVMKDDFEISSDFEPASYDKNSEKRQIHAIYNINGGGPAIRIATVNGDIYIKKNQQ